VPLAARRLARPRTPLLRPAPPRPHRPGLRRRRDVGGV